MSDEQLETPFNMAMLYYIELHNLRELKSKAFIMGEINVYRDILEEIYSNISFKLKKDERRTIQDLFVEADRLLMNNSNKARGRLRVIDMKMIILMHKYKMIFPKVKGDGLANFMERYNLNGKKNNSK